MIDRWETQGDTPRARILHYIHIVETNEPRIKRYGCPIGTLSTELAKLTHTHHPNAIRLFTLFRSWLAHQFRHAGIAEKDADHHALHILSWSQGIATMMATFQDDAFVNREITKMTEWLDRTLPSPLSL